jgi:hypothetical protein
MWVALISVLDWWFNDEKERRSERKWKLESFCSFLYWVVSMAMLLCVNFCLLNEKYIFKILDFFFLYWLGRWSTVELQRSIALC